MRDKIPLHRFQWNLDRLNLKDNVTSCSFKPKIALIDSGIDYNHAEFINKINLDESCNILNSAETILDNIGHGTMVAGIICAENMIRGCSANVELIVYKITDEFKYKVKNLLCAIKKAIESKVQIINLSLSLPFDKLDENTTELFCKEFERANNNNIIIVIAAGNGNKKIAKNFTNQFNNVYLIGATDREGLKSSYSNYGAIDYLAPGGDWRQVEYSLDDPIITCFPMHLSTMDALNNNIGFPKGYCISYGTSIAAAHFTGYIAYLMVHYVNITDKILTLNEIRLILNSNVYYNLQPQYSLNGEIGFSNANVK